MYIILSRTERLRYLLFTVLLLAVPLVLLHARGVELRLLIGASGVVRKKQQQLGQVPRASKVSQEVIPPTLLRLLYQAQKKCSRFMERVQTLYHTREHAYLYTRYIPRGIYTSIPGTIYWYTTISRNISTILSIIILIINKNVPGILFR